MRVALIHYSAPPIVGGVEQVLTAHARLFREARHEVAVISRRGEPDVLLRQSDSYDELKHALEAADWVIVHNVLTMPFDMPLTQAVLRLSGEAREKRWTAWVHDVAATNPDYQHHDWRSSPWNLLTRACSTFEYVAISRPRADQFGTLTGRGAEIIPNGIAPTEVLGLSRAVGALCATHRLFQRELVLLHPTRLLARKNVQLGLEVIAELRSRGRDAVLLITAAADPHNAKSADYENALRERRRELGLESLALFVRDEFLPDSADLASIYRVADGLFFPSTQEGFGLPVLEAALHRLPIFCADLEPMRSLLREAIHPFDPLGSTRDVATLIEQTLEHSSAHRARREALQRYSWEVVWKQYLLPLLERGSQQGA
jgi:glycosyltransferase involved in cell wall biosynthesis